MKTNRPYFLRATALIAFSCVTAWVFQQWRLNDRPKFTPAPVVALTPEQQKAKEYLQQTQEIDRLAAELRRAAVRGLLYNVNDLQMRIEALKRARGNAFGSVDFTPPDLPKRIPAGATDPDSVWRGQMQNARATMREAGIPAPR